MPRTKRTIEGEGGPLRQPRMGSIVNDQGEEVAVGDPVKPSGRGEDRGKRAAGYVRVSTIEQQRHGWNLGEDRERIRERADAEGWDLVELYDDGGRQGDDQERAGLQALLAAASAGELDVLILRDLDRLSRDRYIYALAVRAFETAGVAVYEFDKPEPVAFDLATDVRAAVAQDEKRKIGVRVKLARAGRERAGLVAGGHAPYGYRWSDKRLVQVPARAAAVRRIHEEYAAGVGQRGIVRALNADGIRSATGRPWHQSGVSRVLAQPLYAGKLPNGEDAEHEAIVPRQLWERVQAIRSGSPRKGGQAHGAHLLTRGVMRCTCGAAMLPRKARPGVERERYVCAGRTADPRSCSQPSIRRERIDKPFLRTLLDGYIDLEATRQRIEQRSTSALALAREALDQAEADAAGVEYDRRLARIRRGWQDEVIDDAEYARQLADLESEHEAVSEAAGRRREHVAQIERSGIAGDAEGALLDHLAVLKRAVASGADEAPDLPALRNAIGDMLAEVRLVRSGTWPQDVADGVIPWHDDVPAVTAGDDRYWLLLVLRSSIVDPDTAKPIGQAMPVPCDGQYPPGFLARYCWW
jgi:DNA invertase Pin-like site-specific DNA recombinase